jgi:uncharacterized BrkB/YihY/UPF0761 family membrane protein
LDDTFPGLKVEHGFHFFAGGPELLHGRALCSTAFLLITVLVTSIFSFLKKAGSQTLSMKFVYLGSRGEHQPSSGFFYPSSSSACINTSRMADAHPTALFSASAPAPCGAAKHAFRSPAKFADERDYGSFGFAFALVLWIYYSCIVLSSG